MMDDIVVFGSTEEEHDSRLDRVLAKLADAGVTLNKNKCSFKQQEIKFLGHVIGKEEAIRPAAGWTRRSRSAIRPAAGWTRRSRSAIRPEAGRTREAVVLFAPQRGK